MQNQPLESFSGMDQSPEHKKMLMEYSKKPQGYLLLAGTNGSGKTYASMAIYNENTTFKLPHYNDDEAIFITQSDLNTEFKSNPDVTYFLRKYKNTKLLILDDMGTRNPTEAFLDFLYSIFDYRYQNRIKCGTIITTNLNSLGIREKFGTAILSRISSGIIIRWDSPDRRMPKF